MMAKTKVVAEEEARDGEILDILWRKEYAFLTEWM